MAGCRTACFFQLSCSLATFFVYFGCRTPGKTKLEVLVTAKERESGECRSGLCLVSKSIRDYGVCTRSYSLQRCQKRSTTTATTTTAVACLILFFCLYSSVAALACQALDYQGSCLLLLVSSGWRGEKHSSPFPLSHARPRKKVDSRWQAVSAAADSSAVHLNSRRARRQGQQFMAILFLY